MPLYLHCVPIGAACLLLALAVGLPAPAEAQVGRTRLVGIEQGSAQSASARSLGRGGYELSNGDWVDFQPWYSSRWIDMRASFLTEITERTGFLWGVSTGERGEKYKIDPGLQIGFIHVIDFGENSNLTISLRSVLWGNLEERACVADYGDIGGIQRVNCRLAATPLPPEETLGYLLRRKGFEDTRLSIRFEHRF